MPAALVTGGAGGIGLAAVRCLARDGWEVVAVDRDEGRLEQARHAGAAQVHACDLTDDQRFGDVCETVAGRGEPLQCVVAVAGGRAGENRSVLDLTISEWRTWQEVNLTTMFVTIRGTFPLLRAAGGGSFVGVASGTANHGHPVGTAAYAAAKSGVIGLMRALAVEHGRDGIRVNSVSPGVVATPDMVARYGEVDAVREFVDTTIGEQALGDWTTPDDIGNACAFLASPGARAITGQDLSVDGGWRL